MRYYAIVGKEKHDGKWIWAHLRKDSVGGEFWYHKILYKEDAQLNLRLLKISAETVCNFSAKLGKVQIRDIPEEYITCAAFNVNDYARNKEYAECLQVKYNEKPYAIFYAIPMIHEPDLVGDILR